jgi:hypothetical protein
VKACPAKPHLFGDLAWCPLLPMRNSRDASPTPPFAYKYCSQHQHEGEKFLNEGRISKERNLERGEKKGKKKQRE